jgi:hypothetical protein
MRIAFALVLTLGLPAFAAVGTVTGVSVSPAHPSAGAAVKVTVTGTNPCGAVEIDYGDGAVITYPIPGLPTTQTHAYRGGGAYTLVARGLGNCSGEASTSVEVSGPPPQPPPPVAQITGMRVTPAPWRVGEPVGFTVTGTGSCNFTIDYGDGNRQEVNAGFPWQGTHTYAAAQPHQVTVGAVSPCVGNFTEVVRVGPAAAVARITGIRAVPQTANVGERVGITVEGSGVCAYRLDFGDGTSEERSRELPDRLTRSYQAIGIYRVSAVGEPPCTGAVSTQVEVRPSGPGISAVDVTPNPVRQGTPASISIGGSGTCRVAVDFGDGQRRTIEGPLPRRLTHSYAGAGRYAVQAQAEAPCLGLRTVTIEVVPPG